MSGCESSWMVAYISTSSEWAAHYFCCLTLDCSCRRWWRRRYDPAANICAMIINKIIIKRTTSNTVRCSAVKKEGTTKAINDRATHRSRSHCAQYCPGPGPVHSSVLSCPRGFIRFKLITRTCILHSNCCCCCCFIVLLVVVIVVVVVGDACMLMQGWCPWLDCTALYCISHMNGQRRRELRVDQRRIKKGGWVLRKRRRRATEIRGNEWCAMRVESVTRTDHAM